MSLGLCCRYVASTLADSKASVTNRLWTPLDLMLSGFAWTSLLMACAINFLLSGVLNWHLAKGQDYIGAFHDLTNSTTLAAAGAPFALPPDAALVSVTAPGDNYVLKDLLTTVCLVTFFTHVGSVSNRAKIKEGVANPIDPAALGLVRTLWPAVRFDHVMLRALIAVVQTAVPIYLATHFTLGALCSNNWMAHDGVSGACVVPLSSYVWFKGVWAVVVAWAAWPAATIGSLRVDHLPADVLKAYTDRVDGVTTTTVGAGAGAGAGAADAGATTGGAAATDGAGAEDEVVGADTRSRRNGSAPMPQGLTQRK